MKLLHTTVITLFISWLLPVAQAQTGSKADDIESIKAMTGCYAVTFKYAETFKGDTAYQRHDNYKTGAEAEWIFVDEETDDKIVIQHLLVARDTIIIKHWRQDWIYENTDFYTYDKNKHWSFESKSPAQVSEQWTQKVYQVDDGPRYEGTATWLHVDGKHYWENTTAAPLPRREHTKRDDYNVMIRRNRHEITDYGWLHELDNKKIIRKNDKDSLLVMEKGYNTYRKIDESECQAAKDWWKKHKRYWRLVREVWNEVFAEKKDLYFKEKIDGKKRYNKLFALGNKVAKQEMSDQQVKEKVRKIIDAYLSHEPVKDEKRNEEKKKDGAY